MFPLPDYRVIRGNRRTLMILITERGELIVKAPFYIPNFLIKKFVIEKSGWISKKLEHMHKFSIKKKKYSDGDKFLYLGESYDLHIGDYTEIKVNDYFCFPRFLSFRLTKEIENWYIKAAKEKIMQRVNHYSLLMDAEYFSISFSDTKSKWGSCSRDNFLQFNWKLIMAPLLVIDYVVVHELAHTKEKNHSRDFWMIVKKYKPAWKQYKKWLRDNAQRMTI